MCCSSEGGVGNIWCRSAEPGEERDMGLSEYTAQAYNEFKVA